MDKILKKLPKKARYNLFLSDVISGTIIIGIIFIIKAIISNLSFIPDNVNLIVKIVFFGFIGYKFLDLIITQVIGYRRIQYSIDEESVEKKTGVLFFSHEIIPIRKMQQIDIEQGPINKLFGLSNITVVTAGGKVDLEYIEESESKEIADLLTKKVNEFAKEAKIQAQLKTLNEENLSIAQSFNKNINELENKNIDEENINE